MVARRSGSRVRKRARLLYFSNVHYRVPSVICRIEYDPNRSSFISLLYYSNGVFCYVLNTLGTFVGNAIHSYFNLDVFSDKGLAIILQNGDTTLLEHMPIGGIFHNLELFPLSGGSFSRAAGTYCMILRKFLNIRKAYVFLPSKKYRTVSFFCHLVKGIVGNYHYNKESIGKAGVNRMYGIHPVVRGVAKNPVDHPHGGGEGKKSKKCHPRTAWGRMLH